MSKADSAIRLILAGFFFTVKNKGAYYTDFEVMDKIKYYQEHIRNYYELISGCSSKLNDALVRRSTMAVALVTLDEASKFISSDRIYEFWQRLADGDKLEKGDPRFFLRERLLISRVSGGKDSGLIQLSIANACKIVVLAWNSYIEDKKMSKVHIPDGAIPIRLTSHIIPYKGTNQ